MTGQTSSFDLSDTLTLLFAKRVPKFPLEPEIALIEFMAWILWPDKPQIVKLSRQVAAARAIRDLLNKEPWTKDISASEQDVTSIMTAVFDPRSLSDTLLSFEPIFRFSEDIEVQEATASEVLPILWFFMSYDQQQERIGGKPSLNKAYFFIDEGGFGEDGKRSPASLKTDWVTFAERSCFIYAASAFEDFWIAADEELAIPMARELLDDPEAFQAFVREARYVQDELLRHLDRVSQARFKFPTFPDFIEPAAVEAEPFDEGQLAILKRYQAKLIG